MILNDENFMLYAAKYYDMKRSISEKEFLDDLKRIQYIKRLFKKYRETGDLKIRLILNHVIVLYNCFEEGATSILWMKLEEYHNYLKPIVLFLNRLPNTIEYNDKIVIVSDIPMDTTIVNELRQI